MKKIVDQELLEQEIKRDLRNNVGEKPLTDREAERFERAIIDGVMLGLSIDELAKICCYSLSTFKRRFSEQYNIPPHRWMLQCRMHLACLILTTTDAPITSVATTCGFVNNSHFIATFRRHVGITPRQFRYQSRV